jgi:hypothetical protein
MKLLLRFKREAEKQEKARLELRIDGIKTIDDYVSEWKTNFILCCMSGRIQVL